MRWLPPLVTSAVSGVAGMRAGGKWPAGLAVVGEPQASLPELPTQLLEGLEGSGELMVVVEPREVMLGCRASWLRLATEARRGVRGARAGQLEPPGLRGVRELETGEDGVGDPPSWVTLPLNLAAVRAPVGSPALLRALPAA